MNEADKIKDLALRMAKLGMEANTSPILSLHALVLAMAATIYGLSHIADKDYKELATLTKAALDTQLSQYENQKDELNAAFAVAKAGLNATTEYTA